MGTHMWSNGASRRGRRMSLDLPPIPMTPKDSEFLQRRPDLFYPYLPAPFLNGMQQKVTNRNAVMHNERIPERAYVFFFFFSWTKSRWCRTARMEWQEPASTVAFSASVIRRQRLSDLRRVLPNDPRDRPAANPTPPEVYGTCTSTGRRQQTPPEKTFCQPLGKA